MSSADALRARLEDLAKRAEFQRRIAHSKAMWFGRLNGAASVAATVLSLVAAGSIGCELANLVTSQALKWIAVITSIVSAVLSGIVSAFFSEKSVVHLHTAAADYLDIRETAYRAILASGENTDSLARALEVVQAQYKFAAKLYGQYGVTSAGIQHFSFEEHADGPVLIPETEVPGIDSKINYNPKPGPVIIRSEAPNTGPQPDGTAGAAPRG